MPYKDPEMKRKNDREYRQKNREKILAQHAEYREANRNTLREKAKIYYAENKKACNSRSKKYYEENRDHLLEWQKEYRQKNKKRLYENSKNTIHDFRSRRTAWASSKVSYAIKTGKITPSFCEICGEEKAEAHHDDYNKPLEVRWLCRKCHTEWHKHNTPIYIKEDNGS